MKHSKLPDYLVRYIRNKNRLERDPVKIEIIRRYKERFPGCIVSTERL